MPRLYAGDYVSIQHSAILPWSPGMQPPDAIVLSGTPDQDGRYHVRIDQDVVAIFVGGQGYGAGARLLLPLLDLPPTLLNTRDLEEWLDA